MKRTAPYFGNRFATVATKKATKQAVSEMEALEPRLLLSGITDGSKVLKSYNFTDADGDKVSIKLTGKVGKGAGFQVDGLGNGFDVNEINLVGDLSKANLVVSVKPVKLINSDRTTSNMIVSPGYTNIGSITADDQTNSKGANVSGSLALRNIGLTAAVVGSIDLGNTDIAGGITLNAGKTAWVDRINTASPTTPGFQSSYNPVAGLIDLHDVTAASVGRITINGVVGAALNNPSGLPAESNTNDFLGNITITGGLDGKNANLGGIIGARSVLYSNVDVAGNLGNVIVGSYQGTITTGGDLTISLPAGSQGAINAGGHVNLAFQPANAGATVTSTNITAGNGISGFKPSTTDTLVVPTAYQGLLTDTNITGKNIGVADIIVIGGASNFSVNAAYSIGDITASGFDTGGTAGTGFISGAGGIGDVTAYAGKVAVNFTTTGSIGDISATGGTVSGNFTAGGNIGSFEGTNQTGNVLTGSLTAGGSIGAIEATSQSGGGLLGDITAGTSIASITVDISGAGGAAIDADIVAGTTIGGILVDSAATGDNGTVQGSIEAGNGIGDIDITSNSSTAALLADINADTANSWSLGIVAPNRTTANLGLLASLTVVNEGTGDGIDGSDVQAVTIGNIEVTVNGDSADGIVDAVFTASSTTETILGKGIYNDFGLIGNITVVGNTTTGAGNGIYESKFYAGNAGAIGQIRVTMENITGLGTGQGIFGGVFDATKSSGFNNDAIKTSSIGSITVSHNGPGGAIDSADFFANDGVGAIIVTSQGTGMAGVDVQADNDDDGIGNLASIDVEVTGAGGASGILDGTFKGANIGTIQVDLTNTSVTGNGIDGAKFTAHQLSATTVANEFENRGTIGAITVTNSGTSTSAGGIVGNAEFNAGKAGGASAIGAANVTVAAVTNTFAGAAAINNVTFDATKALTTVPAGGTQSATIDAVVGQITTVGGTGITGLTVNAAATVTGITSNGTDNHLITVNAPTVGALLVDNLDNSKTVSYTVGASVTSLGQITVRDASTDVGNLTLTGTPAALATVTGISVDGAANISALSNLAANANVGAILVDGQFAVGSVLSTAKTMSTFNVGSLSGGPLTIGAASNLSGSIGLITVNSALIAPPVYTFNFGSFNGGGTNTVANIGAAGSVETIAQVAGVPTAPVTNTGIAFTRV